MTVSADGMIRVRLDDTRENRHPTIPPKQLDERAQAELNDILSLKALREFDREYVGLEPDPPALTSWRLKVVYTFANANKFNGHFKVVFNRKNNAAARSTVKLC